MNTTSQRHPSNQRLSAKPVCAEAMQNLLLQIRATFPFDIPPATLCDGPCTGCPKKLLDYLLTEVEQTEADLAAGQTPSLGDIDRLAKSARKIHRVLLKNERLAALLQEANPQD